MSALAPTLQSFFAEYLCGQRAAGGQTPPSPITARPAGHRAP